MHCHTPKQSPKSYELSIFSDSKIHYLLPSIVCLALLLASSQSCPDMQQALGQYVFIDVIQMGRAGGSRLLEVTRLRQAYAYHISVAHTVFFENKILSQCGSITRWLFSLNTGHNLKFSVLQEYT